MFSPGIFTSNFTPRCTPLPTSESLSTACFFFFRPLLFFFFLIISRINTSRPAGKRRGSPSSTAAAASSFPRRISSLPLRRRSLSPERRRSRTSAEEPQEDRERASTGAGDDHHDGGGPLAAGGEAGGRTRASCQRPAGLPRHRSHSSLPWFFRPRSASLSSRDGAGRAGGGGGEGGGDVAVSFASVGNGGDLRQQQQHQHQQRSCGGGSGGSGGGSSGDKSSDGVSFIVDKHAALGAEGRLTTVPAASPGTAAAAAVVSPSTTPGSHVNREASTRSMGSTATADSKEGVRDGGGRGHARPSSFFQHLAPHARHGGDHDGAGAGMEEELAGPVFDLPLVKNGLPRGRIRGRCTLVLGSSSGNSLLRLGSVGALSVGGVASVGGVGVAGVCAYPDRRDSGGGGDGGGSASSTGGRAAARVGGGGRKKLARFFPGGRRGRSRSASNGSRSRSGSSSRSRSPAKKRGIVDHAATFPPQAGSGDGGRTGTGAGENGRPRLPARSKSYMVRSARRLGGGEGRRDSTPTPSGCVSM